MTVMMATGAAAKIRDYLSRGQFLSTGRHPGFVSETMRKTVNNGKFQERATEKKKLISLLPEINEPLRDRVKYTEMIPLETSQCNLNDRWAGLGQNRPRLHTPIFSSSGVFERFRREIVATTRSQIQVRYG